MWCNLKYSSWTDSTKCKSRIWLISIKAEFKCWRKYAINIRNRRIRTLIRTIHQKSTILISSMIPIANLIIRIFQTKPSKRRNQKSKKEFWRKIYHWGLLNQEIYLRWTPLMRNSRWNFSPGNPSENSFRISTLNNKFQEQVHS